MKWKSMFIVILILGLVILSACQRGDKQTLTPEFNQVTSILSATPTLTPTHRPTNTITPSLYPTRSNTPTIISATPTPTFSATATITPTEGPTPTPLPEIPKGKAKKLLLEWILKNGGCQLPCVLGLTPGKSDYRTYDAVSQYIQANVRDFDQVEKISFVNDVFMKIGKGDVYNSVDLFFEYIDGMGVHVGYIYDRGSKPQKIYLDSSAHQAVTRDGEQMYRMIHDHPYINQVMHFYTLSQILNSYGSPSQIFIAPEPPNSMAPSTAWYIFYVSLYYPEQGFLVMYESLRHEKGSSYLGCPNQSYIRLVAWDPVTTISLKEANQGMLSGLEWEQFKTLEEATSLDIATFVNLYKKDKNYCIETPKELWPERKW